MAIMGYMTKVKIAIKPGLGSLRAVDRLPFYAPKGLRARDVDQALREERRERLTGRSGRVNDAARQHDPSDA